MKTETPTSDAQRRPQHWRSTSTAPQRQNQESNDEAEDSENDKKAGGRSIKGSEAERT